MEFTKEEISLCKQVAERYRKEIEYGDWFLNGGGFAKVWPYRHNCKRVDVIPLWTISDCLEFLREGGFTIVQACEHPMSNEWIIEINPYFSNAIKIMGDKSFDVRGDTILEACLKAVLAVVKEGK